MAALTTDRDTQIIAKPTLKGYPVAASTTIYKGGMVCIDADGYAIPASDTSGISGTIGVADETVDNSSGADGDKKVRVRSGEIYDFTATSITQAMLGTVMYVVDDQTFDDAAGATNEIAAGILAEYVSSTRGKIFIPTGGMNVDIPNLSVATADIIDAAVTNVKLAAGGPGFVTGEGGAVTQITNASTGVTLNKRAGVITTVALSTAAGAEERFTVTNSEVDANDVVAAVVGEYAGAGTPVVSVIDVAAGTFDIVITNLHASAALDALITINFAVIKSVAA